MVSGNKSNNILSARDHLYTLYLQELTYDEALQSCKERGQMLAKIDTAAKFSELRNEFAKVLLKIK